MDKEFEALEKLEECANGMKDLPKSNWIDLAENEAELDLKIMDWVETIKFELFKGNQALTELKQIKEAKPSEAFGNISRGLETIENDLIALAKLGVNETFDDLLLDISKTTQLIKKDLQALLKAQEQEEALRLVSQHLSFEDGGTAIIKDFINDKEETKHIIKVVSKDTGATITILLDTKEEVELLNRHFGKNIQKQ